MEKEEILQKLGDFRKNDIPWRNGRLFSYVYFLDKETEEIGKLAYMEYLTENGIDATAFASLQKMENEVIHFCREILRGDQEVVGTLTTGGTESILLAVKTARDRARALNPQQTEFEMILPETVHAAFYKAAHYFGVKPITVQVDDVSCKATASLIEPHINSNTILIAASAMSYAYGVVDEIESIGPLALEKNIPFHVDGCIGAFILATARIGGYNIEDFDFTIPGVTSISMDLHKYAYCPKGASVLLFKNDGFRKHQLFVCNEWTGYTFANTGILSSKTGGPIAAAWAVTHYLGLKRYADIALKTFEVAQTIRQKLSEHPEIEILADPKYSLISFTTPGINIYVLSDELKARKWYAGLQFKHRHIPANIHLTVAAHHFNNYQEFINDVFEAIEKAKKENPPLLGMDLSNIQPEDVPALLSKLGVQSEGLPDKLALINQALEQLPKAVSKELLIGFMQGMYR
jgi:glutamate/tyrosine decarboxylase-like PLP-dependent enzyme